MTQKIITVDAFTGEAFAGNPAAVCVLPKARDDRWMQLLAREMNLSETAFLVRRDDDSFDLRWFTPAVEVELCGHATLASAHALWETSQLALDAQACFHTKSGLLTATKRGDWIELDFPARPVRALKGNDDDLARALGSGITFAGQTAYDAFVEVKDEATLRGLSPDFARLRQTGARGVIVTSAASAASEFDFLSRFFAPGSGIDEDPVTGSAHCSLGPYWQAKLKRDEFTAYQASARGGIVKLTVVGDRVQLRGQAVTIMHGELHVG